MSVAAAFKASNALNRCAAKCWAIGEPACWELGFNDLCAECVAEDGAAQGIDARSGETRCNSGLDPKDESPVGETDAPKE